MNKYKFKLLTSTGLGCEYFYCYGDEHFEQWLKRKNIKYEIDKKSINRFNKQKEVLDKIKKLELYEFDLDYDYEGNPVEHYTPFFMREYIEKLLEEIE